MKTKNKSEAFLLGIKAFEDNDVTTVLNHARMIPGNELIQFLKNFIKGYSNKTAPKVNIYVKIIERFFSVPADGDPGAVLITNSKLEIYLRKSGAISIDEQFKTNHFGSAMAIVGFKKSRSSSGRFYLVKFNDAIEM